MTELALQQPELIGREEELNKLKQSLDNAIAGKGSTTFIAGEAGIGKTRIVSELIKEAEAKNVQLIQGWCLSESLEPLMPVKTALRESGLLYLISGDPPPLVVSAYLLNKAGMLISQVEREETNLDSDIFAGMLQAVGNFVQDSLSMMKGGGTGSLNSLGFGDFTILIQSTGNLSLATVIEGTNSEFLIEDMKRTLNDIGDKFDDWVGDVSSTKEIQPKIAWFVNSGKFDGRFLVDDPRIKQENLFDNILLGIQRASEDKPILLFLDDLQWSDHTTMNIIHYLSRNTRNNNVLILGTYRPEDISEGLDSSTHHLETSMQGMTREDLLNKMELKRLDAQGTEKIVQSMLGKTSFEYDFFDKIFRETDGSPFFILEVIKMLVEDGAIAQDKDGIWHIEKDLDELNIPSKVYDVVKRRLNRLIKEQKLILECASVVGNEFQSEIVRTVTGSNRISLLKNLSEIEKSHKLIHSFEKKYVFDHAKIREVLYNEIMDELKQEYHRIVGDTLSELYKDNLDEIINELAYHYYEAGDHRAIEHLIRAGDMAKEKYANEEAIKLYEDAIRLSGSEVNLEILEKLGDIQSTIGEYDAAIETFGKVKDLTEDNEVKARNLRMIGDIYGNTGEYDKSLEIFANAKEVAEEGTAEYGRICRNESSIYERKGDYDKGLALSNAALKYFEESGAEKKDIGDTFRIIGNLNASKGNFNTALEYYEKSLPIMKEINELYGIAAALNNIGTVYTIKGDMVRELEYYERSLEIFDNIGFKLGIATLLNNIGNVNYTKGELTKALNHYERSLKTREMIGDQQGIAMSLNNMGFVEYDKGEPANALEYYQRSLKLCMAIGDKYIPIHAHCGIADTYIEMKDVQKAFENAEKAIEIAVEIGAKAEEGMGHRVFGKVHRVAEDLDKAEEEFQKAKTIFDAAGEKVELAVLSYEQALLFKEKAKPAKARENLEKTLSEFEEMGMKLWVERCEKALESL